MFSSLLVRKMLVLSQELDSISFLLALPTPVSFFLTREDNELVPTASAKWTRSMVLSPSPGEGQLRLALDKLKKAHNLFSIEIDTVDTIDTIGTLHTTRQVVAVEDNINSTYQSTVSIVSTHQPIGNNCPARLAAH
jgi:hypothetical protein